MVCTGIQTNGSCVGKQRPFPCCVSLVPFVCVSNTASMTDLLKCVGQEETKVERVQMKADAGLLGLKDDHNSPQLAEIICVWLAYFYSCQAP